jgi:capsular polysaccharide biosynthesis protein
MLEPDDDQLQVRAANVRDEPFHPPRPKPLFGIGSFVRHARFIGACGVAVLVLGGLVVLVKPAKYTAATHLLVFNRELLPGSEPIILKGRADVSVVQNEIELIQSRVVLTKAAEALNLDKEAARPSLVREIVQAVGGWFSRAPGTPSSQARLSQAVDYLKTRLSVRRVGTSHAISIGFTEADPVVAAQIANEVARAYLQTRAAASGPEATRDLALRERLQGLGPNAYVISTAEPPWRPDGPAFWMVLAAGLVAGLGLGSALALAIDFADRSFRTPVQAEFVLGLECLGTVPDLAGGEARHRGGWRGGWREDARRYLAMIRKAGGSQVPERLRRRGERDEAAMPNVRDPNDRIVQALRRTAALIATRPRLASIGITSTVPGEGVTTIATHLAWLLAGEGRKVLLIDAMPRPALQDAPPATMRFASAPGWSAAGAKNWPDFVRLDSGTGDSDAAWTAALQAQLHDGAKTHDLVIIDLPALADGPNVRLAATVLDAFLLVLKWGDTDSELVLRALHSSGRARSRVVGAILNFVDERRIGTYGDKLAATQMTLSTPEARAGQPISDTPTTLPAGGTTKANA